MDSTLDQIELLCIAAQLMLENGSETYRVEETVQRMKYWLDESQR